MYKRKTLVWPYSLFQLFGWCPSGSLKSIKELSTGHLLFCHRINRPFQISCNFGDDSRQFKESLFCRTIGSNPAYNDFVRFICLFKGKRICFGGLETQCDLQERHSIRIPSLIAWTRCMKMKIELISLLQSISLKLLNIQSTTGWSLVSAAIFREGKKRDICIQVTKRWPTSSLRGRISRWQSLQQLK